jgi:hypothetical protein
MIVMKKKLKNRNFNFIMEMDRMVRSSRRLFYHVEGVIGTKEIPVPHRMTLVGFPAEQER